MPEFNNIRYELNNGEKFALICGMLAGLRLQDKTQPPDQVTVTLEPIGVNGLGTIGLMAEDVKYTGINQLRIPVITHDVDREYSGFSLRVTYNSSQIVITSIDNGDFGTLQGTSIGNGVAYTRCMLDKGQFKKEPVIVCWLNCIIVSPPTKGNPIELTFANSTGYNGNYCSLLTWVLNEVDNNYYSYFITPTVNKGCKITSDEIGSVTNNFGDEQQVSTTASPSLIAMGTIVIWPGREGLVPIYTNCNKNDNFIYNGFILKAIIPAKWLDILTEIGIGSTGEWTLSYTKSYNSNGDLVLDITGSRSEARADNSTVGFIRFLLSSAAVSIACLLENNYSELTGPYGALGVLKGDGYLGYPPPPPGTGGGGGGGFGLGSSGWGSGGGAGGGTGGGMIGSGNIWSGTSQDIWVGIGNGNKYPIHLEPGNNNVHFWIPNLRPEDVWEETTPTIEAPGYILIPGGFEFETIINPEAPLGLSSPRIIDRFEIKDVYDLEKITPEPPVNIDGIIEEFLIQDFEELDVQQVNILMQEFIENFEVGDELKTEILNILQTDSDFVDNMDIQDILDVEVEHTPIEYDEACIDEYDIEDTIETTLVNVTILDSPNEEQVGIEDVTDTDTISCDISEQSSIDTFEIGDIMDIEVN